MQPEGQQEQPRGPRTIPQLLAAIEGLFTFRGEFDGRAALVVGDQLLKANTYASGILLGEGSGIPLEAWHPSPEAAIQATWHAMLALHKGEITLASAPEWDEGVEEPPAIAPRSVFWRVRPELCTFTTGICHVRMRAAFV